MEFNSMKYSLITTQNHPISINHPECTEDINSLLKHECNSLVATTFTNAEIVINLDTAEAILAHNQSRQRNKSMDITFGISNVDLSIKMMVMVELRLNFENPYNLNRQSLEDKVKFSLIVLTNFVPIYPKFIFVFQAKIKEEAKNRFYRMNPKIPSDYVVMDLNDLKAAFFV